ncbi:DUF3142 domain-containing protein [Novosphingobium sp. JCM 18896]|uniref:DUF3142 domain-containing protein n=1 Tax=Novosphingobium sp. JCM 18896 TaxID=2989731 RepID=UPI0022216EE4|nr:DUF3142 domain-containing protein [Novosphingobium sp. JCM 18896]MCW1430618.1 DUF3142 domain-containing protein [Novosphingobium sp. JCM 18896]
MRLRRWLAAALGLVLLAGCGGEKAARVDPADYDAVFLWAGVPSSSVPRSARTVYLLAGEVRADDPGRFVSLRPATPKGSGAALWYTVRVERLDWSEAVYARVLADLARWRAAGNRVVGLQIDFDARTRGLADYARFLAGLRRRMRHEYQLSITGLMDWSAQGHPAALAQLAGTVDEVVIQTYQGRSTIPGYQAYMASLAKLPLPYRVGVVEDGEWQAPQDLENDPEFRGYVVFLLPPSRQAPGVQATARRN